MGFDVGMWVVGVGNGGADGEVDADRAGIGGDGSIWRYSDGGDSSLPNNGGLHRIGAGSSGHNPANKEIIL